MKPILEFIFSNVNWKVRSIGDEHQQTDQHMKDPVQMD